MMLFAFAAMLLVCAPSEAVPGAKTIIVGSETLTRCDNTYGGYCGHIARALDPTGQVPGKIRIGFIYFPQRETAEQPLETIVTTEGGPGYSSTGSRDGYLRLFGVQRDRHPVLIVDNRGTGRSGVVDCKELQLEGGNRAVAACADHLEGATALYGTALAADDMAAVFDALALDKVDLYGDSYGTYFGQVFAYRHPDRLRTLILDSAYPVNGGSFYAVHEWAAAVDGVDKACRRSPSCAALGGSAVQRISDLVADIRKKPIHGVAPGPDGQPIHVTIGVPAMIGIWGEGAYLPTVYRELDAAVRAYRAGDKLPLLRLGAESSSAVAAGSFPRAYSAGLAVAVTCNDYPVRYRLNSSTQERKAEVTAELAHARSQKPDVYAPFTFDEGVLNFLESPYECVSWPKPPHGYVQGHPIPADAKFGAIPTLVLSGEFDTTTSTAGARIVASQFPASTFVHIPNSIHEVAISTGGYFPAPIGADSTGCVMQIVNDFVRTGGNADTSCAPHVRPFRTVPAFEKRAANALPPAPLKGNEASALELAYASAAMETAGDVLARFSFATYAHGSGLRGGHFRFSSYAKGYDFELADAMWTNDLKVGGTMRWDQTTGSIKAHLAFNSPSHTKGEIDVQWNDRETNAIAVLNGIINGHRVEASRIAP